MSNLLTLGSCNLLRRLNYFSQDPSTIRFDLQRQQMIGPRDALVDGDDRLAQPMGLFGKTVTGIHHQRRTDHQQGIRGFPHLLGRRDPLARHVVAEEDHVRFEYPNALGTIGNGKAGINGIDEVGIAVRGQARGSRLVVVELWIGIMEPCLNLTARKSVSQERQRTFRIPP